MKYTIFLLQISKTNSLFQCPFLHTLTGSFMYLYSHYNGDYSSYVCQVREKHRHEVESHRERSEALHEANVRLRDELARLSDIVRRQQQPSVSGGRVTSL